MAQLQLPIFPAGYTAISQLVGFEKKDGWIYYFHGSLPVYLHAEDDEASFRFITSEMVRCGHIKQKQISDAFGVSYISVKRSVKRLREEGARAFFKGGRWR